MNTFLHSKQTLSIHISISQGVDCPQKEPGIVLIFLCIFYAFSVHFWHPDARGTRTVTASRWHAASTVHTDSDSNHTRLQVLFRIVFLGPSSFGSTSLATVTSRSSRGIASGAGILPSCCRPALQVSSPPYLIWPDLTGQCTVFRTPKLLVSRLHRQQQRKGISRLCSLG